MDPDTGQSGGMRLTPGFELHERMGASTPGFESAESGLDPVEQSDVTSGSLGGLPVTAMPTGEMNGNATSGSNDGMHGISTDGSMPTGGMEADAASGAYGALHSMPIGHMRAGFESGADDFGESDIGPGADGMPAAQMNGATESATDRNTVESAERSGELALEGRWRLTLSSITS